MGELYIVLINKIPELTTDKKSNSRNVEGQQVNDCEP